MKNLIYLLLFLLPAQAYAKNCFIAAGTYLMIEGAGANAIIDIDHPFEDCEGETLRFRYGALRGGDHINYVIDIQAEIGPGLKTYIDEFGNEFKYELLFHERSFELTVISTFDGVCETKGGFGYDSYDNPVDHSTFTLNLTTTCEDGRDVEDMSFKLYKIY
ncbi:MAG: hypothetical protein M9899_07415 [Bdellovibrionaceae bacterium]|nr:hypothetical protein [Pseudobdellovibrionaceae bacterium]